MESLISLMDIAKSFLKSFDQKQDSKHTTYLGGKYLYGYAMSKFLSTSGFKWIDPNSILAL